MENMFLNFSFEYNIIFLGYILNVYAFVFILYYNSSNIKISDIEKLKESNEKRNTELIMPTTMSFIGVLVPFLSFISTYNFYRELQLFFINNKGVRYIDFLIEKKCYLKK